ncbi:histidine kinase [uncultured Microbacterium sp.]|uniref:sensor histidine kinase n=1 Tax=uncultured Microbacterium sp. TaxID=191216 RepID=UPI0026247191|nr:histidine kinase [uncultured Microbacterium sp.]
MLRSHLTSLIAQVNARPRTRDAILAAVYLVIGFVLLQFGGYGMWATGLAIPATGLWSAESGFLVLLLLMSALALLRSSRPVLVVALAAPLAAADLLLGSSIGVVLLFADFVYCAFRYSSDRSVRLLLAVIAAVIAITAVVLIVLPGVSVRVVTISLQWALIVLIGALWGWNVRSERQRTRAEMDSEHRRATRLLRQRIAHDLHDLVANQIAVAGLNIEATRLLDIGDDVEAGLARAAAGTDEAHRQLRRLIAVLTTVDDLAEETAQPALGDLAARVPTGRALIPEGADLDAALEALPRSAGIAMRAVQELLTNAVKHGRGDIVLRTTTEMDEVIVEIENSIAARDSVLGSGIGIPGAALLLDSIQATLASEPIDESRWRARMTLIREDAHV